ncbi:unnamed protein product [Cylindrotheca closterium]|uniref:Metacaspase n=1 Tax=Cylindrotheca closterium TaxID=2856 RepID=A0AAD2FVT6_9STRA|nr:unnamed protein product [Cylindrotheca closterium]
MGAEISTPEGEDFMAKSYRSFHESATMFTEHDDEEEVVHTLRKLGRSSSPLIGKEVITTSETIESNHLGPKSLDQSDGKISVNIAMADLMAYLQVVANHSNNLPQTRRDDPAGKECAVATPEEVYANKSAAFIPADVRIVGGRFMLYGKAWNLPDNTEFSPAERTLEPGKSYGGANGNAMLKVLYDFVSASGADEIAFEQDDNDLFDDDDDEASLDSVSKTGGLDTVGLRGESSLSWADLLRKMKAEMDDMKFNQVPTLTTSRKLNVNEDFTLVPKSFDPSTGRTRSLLIGCNYNGNAQLKASHDDIRSMKDYIVTVHGFSEDAEDMTVLLDDGVHKAPTYANIIDHFKKLSEDSQPGDAVFIQFSGHGGRLIGSPGADAVDTYDEAIVPCDFEEAGPIRDTLVFKTLLAPMRYGVTVTVIIDACDTGMVLDLPYAWSTGDDQPGTDAEMVQNKDYSFVRDLKVIKKLYESSVFTQLGNRVDEAIGSQPEPTPTQRYSARRRRRTMGGETDDEQSALYMNDSFAGNQGFCCDPMQMNGLDNVNSEDVQRDPSETSFMARLTDCGMGNELIEKELEAMSVRSRNDGRRSRKSRSSSGRRSKSRRSSRRS